MKQSEAGVDPESQSQFDEAISGRTSTMTDSSGANDSRASTPSVKWSLNAVRFAVFVDAVTAFILDPNYVFMAYPGAHEDSFSNTEPFAFNGATYFLAMTALLGSAISSTFVGHLSDRWGRKPLILVCLVVGAIGAVCNYFARHHFWSFCATNFIQGLFAASSPVAMAYASDVKRTRKEKDEEIGIIVAITMLGIAGGGICSILLQKHGLFVPLFLGAALNIVASLVVMAWVVEPSQMISYLRSNSSSPDDDEEEEEHAPAKIDRRLLTNIIGGALFDNVGSAGLLPLAMSPLAFTHFYANFVEQGEEPIMTQSSFRWIWVMVALMVIPGAVVSQPIFDKIGAAGGCVAGNIVTGLVTMACLFVAYIEPATNATFAAFVAVLYVGFAFAVISQLSTGPMLDAIAPANRRGFIQGLNDAIMKFAMAVSPYLLGLFADNVGIRETMWLCVAISFAAALVNLPLVFAKASKRPPPKLPKYLRPLKGEDEEMITSAMKGEWVPAKKLWVLNDQRIESGEPMLTIPLLSYEEDKHHLDVIRREAKGDFQYIKGQMLEWLDDPMWEDSTKREMLAVQYQKSMSPRQHQEDLAKGLSKWFTDYLMDNGYVMEDSPIQYKQMFMAAFPPILRDKELTGENIQDVCTNYTRVLDKYLKDDDLTGEENDEATQCVDC